MTRRPQKPAVAQRATSSPRLQSDHHCYTSEHTPPQTTDQSSTELTRRPLHPNPRQNNSHTLQQTKHNTSLTMDQAKEFLEMPREFVKDGRQFITRCSKRTSSLPVLSRSVAKGLKRRECSHPLGVASLDLEADRSESNMLLLFRQPRTHTLDPEYECRQTH